MKQLLCIFAAIIFLQTTGYSQPVDSYDNFVLGAFNFWYPGSASTGDDFTTALKEAGINVLYNGPASLYGTSPLNGISGYQYFGYGNPLGLSTNPNHLDYLGGGKDAPLVSTDVRFFLASELGDRINGQVHGQSNLSKFSYDTYFSWGSVQPTAPLGPAGFKNHEWFIPQIRQGADNHTDGVVLLENLQVIGNTSNGDGNSAYLIPTASPHAVCDFIFRIDNSSYSGISGTRHIYEVKYYTKRGSATTFTYDHSDFIDNIGSNSYSTLSSSTNSWWSTDHNRIKFYPLGSNQAYAILHSTIDNSSQDLKSIECKLVETAYSNGIYVRGLRIRSDIADNLLRGVYQTTSNSNENLLTRFAEIKSVINATSGAWAKTRAFATGTEYGSPQHRAFAYIDKKWKQWSGGKRMTTFLANWNNYYWFDAICRDEEEDQEVDKTMLPPFFMSECEAHWAIEATTTASNPNPNPTGYPKDIIPSSRRPISQGSLSNADWSILKDFTLFGAPVQNYATYTEQYQKRLEMCNKVDERISSQGPSGTNPVSWYGGIWAAMSFVTPLIDRSNGRNSLIDPNWFAEFSSPLSYSRFRRQGNELDEIWDGSTQNGSPTPNLGETKSFRQQFIDDIKNGTCYPQDNVYDIRRLMNINPRSISDLGTGSTWNAGDPSKVGGDNV